MIAKKIFFVFSFLFFIALQNNALGTSCTTSSNCPTGEYCSTNAGPNGGVCASCNKPDGATWVSNGPRSGTGVNSCQWQISCVSVAVMCGDIQCGTQTASTPTIYGYGLSPTDQCNYDIIKCSGGFYKSGDSCVKCPYGSTSRSGATSRKNCFFDSGKIINSDDGRISLPDIMYIY